jgi:hypothetical protein
MIWKEVEEGHYVSESGCHEVNGDLKDPCVDCKGGGKRGRGRCRACGGVGERSRRYDYGIKGSIWTTVPWDCDLAKAKAIQERKNDPRNVYQYSERHSTTWSGVLTPMDLI